MSLERDNDRMPFTHPYKTRNGARSTARREMFKGIPWCLFLFYFSISVQFLSITWLQGDLKTFLRATSDDSCSQLEPGSGSLPPLSVAQRITMCGQVALGMEHIADRGLTHRDLAARNILLSPSLHLKVCQCQTYGAV